jgi:hypothetical protein
VNAWHSIAEDKDVRLSSLSVADLQSIHPLCADYVVKVCAAFYAVIGTLLWLYCVGIESQCAVLKCVALAELCGQQMSLLLRGRLQHVVA